MSFQYDYGFFVSTPTIWEDLGGELGDVRYKAAMFNDLGEVVVATSADVAVGIFLSEVLQNVRGDDVELLVKDIGLLRMAEPIKKGDRITINSVGEGVRVKKRDETVFAVALASCSAHGEKVMVVLK